MQGFGLGNERRECGHACAVPVGLGKREVDAAEVSGVYREGSLQNIQKNIQVFGM